jgi:PncC family amidohydrolase
MLQILEPMARDLGATLKRRGETLAVSESSGGGLVSAALLSIGGASSYFVGGGVVYTAQSRSAILGIDLDAHPGIRSASEPYAELCAQAIRDKLDTTWGLAETGASGPAGNRYGDDPGHTCVAVTGPVQLVRTVETRVADREANMWMFARAALELLREALDRA